MKIRIIPWRELNPADAAMIMARSKAPEHDFEEVRLAWEAEAAQQYLYVPIVHDSTERFPLGIFGAGGPLDETVPSWWIDSQYRGKGYARHAIDSFALYLLERGVTGIGRIAMHTRTDDDFQKSAALARRFRSHFRRISIDSNCLTYIIDAMQGVGAPTGPLADENTALLRLYLYLPDTLRVPATAANEAHAIPDAERAATHVSFNSTLFEVLRPRDLVAIGQRTVELQQHHAKEKDCRVLAEAEDARMTVLLTRDGDFARRLHDKTNLALCRPSEYWTSLSVPRGARPCKVPHAANPLSTEAWWPW